jgi:hypothetical protein
MGIIEGNAERAFLSRQEANCHEQNDQGDAGSGRQPAGKHSRDQERSGDEHKAGGLFHT